MAALTNTQISVTYVGLLKTSANTVLSSTAQQITDGSGNNSILYLSTAGVGIGAAAAAGKELDVTGNVLVTGDLQVDNINIDGNTISATSGVVTLANGTIATTQSDGDNSTKVATTAYVDTAIGSHDTLAEILAGGNTTGGTDIAVSANDDITFTSSSKAIFGPSTDLQIYSDSSNNYIDSTSNELRIRSNDLRLLNYGTAKYITADSGADVSLYHNNSKKFETTSTGAKVTGSNFNVFAASGATKLEFGQTNGNWKIEAGNSGNNTLIIGSVSNATNNITLDTTNGGSATFSGQIASKEVSIKQSDDSGFDAGLIIERSANTQKLVIGMDGGAVNFNSPDGLTYKFRNNGTEKASIDGSGNATFSGSIIANDTSKIEKAQVTTQFDTSSFLRLHPSATTNSGGYTNMIFGTDTANNFGVAIGGKREGTDGTPSFSMRMLNDSITGTEVLNISNSGTATFSGDVTINKASNPTKLQIGSSLTDDPFIVFQTDGNTMSMGIDRSDSNKFVISDNATLGTNNRVTIDTSGNATFAGELTANGDLIQVSGAHPELKLNDSDDSNYSLVSYSDGDLLISTNHGNEAGAADTIRFLNNGGTERMRIDSSGNVLVGKTSSTGVATANIEVSNSSSASVQIEGGTHEWSMLVSSSADALRFYQDSTERMRIDSSGNVGINETAPGTLLALGGAKNTSIITLKSTTNDSSWSSGDVIGGINFHSEDGSGAGAGIKGSISYIATSSSGGSTALSFKTSDSSSNNVERMLINNTGLGIGESSPNGKLHIKDGLTCSIDIENTSNTGTGEITFNDPDADDRGVLSYSHNLDAMIFKTAASERMRILSDGDVILGGTSLQAQGALSVSPNHDDGACAVFFNRASTSNTSDVIRFQNDGSTVGSINHNNTSTTYATSSDYRLKEDLQDFNGLDKVFKIKMYDFKWKADGSRGYGVMAHELKEVLPQAVSGEKDAEEMQQVDYSKIVPILVKSIQELKKEIEILKSK